jgi:hypothetical protein
MMTWLTNRLRPSGDIRKTKNTLRGGARQRFHGSLLIGSSEWKESGAEKAAKAFVKWELDFFWKHADALHRRRHRHRPDRFLWEQGKERVHDQRYGMRNILLLFSGGLHCAHEQLALGRAKFAINRPQVILRTLLRFAPCFGGGICIFLIHPCVLIGRSRLNVYSIPG